MQDWRKPAQKIRGRLKDIFLKGLSAVGSYSPKLPSEIETVASYSTTYISNRSGEASPLEEIGQSRLAFRNPPPEKEVAEDLQYTSSGMAWVSGRLVERYSVRCPSIREAISRPARSEGTAIDRAVIVESDVPYTYGDWVCVYLGTALRHRAADGPLLVPEFLAAKAYVARDLRKAGIEYVVADKTFNVKKATILRKCWPLHYWTEREVGLYQNAFAPNRSQPRANTIVYLGRFNFESEVVSRAFPSEAVADIATRLGGKTVDTRKLSPEYAVALGDEVETVIADFGSSVLNIMHWKPRNVIELVVDDWWVNVDLFVARAVGVQNFAVLKIDRLTPAQVEECIRACLTRFEVAVPTA